MEATRHRAICIRFNFLLTLSSLGAGLTQAQQFTVTQIPLPNLSSLSAADVSGAYIIGNGLNNAGEVVGNVEGLTGVAQQAFRYSQGSSKLLADLYEPGLYNAANAINSNGIAVGESENTLGQGNAVSWQSGSITDLGSLYYYTDVGPSPIPGFSSAAAINSKGDVVGVSLGAAGGSTTTDTHAALFSGGAVLDLGTLGGNDSEALGINDSGVIVGDAQLPAVSPQSGFSSHAFSYNGTLHDLGVLPGGLNSYATAINSSGAIVGWSETVTGGTGHAFLIPPGGLMQDLGTLNIGAGTLYSYANAINSSGQIVGELHTSIGYSAAFIYSNGVMKNLNSLVTGPLAGSVTFTNAAGINDAGQILATSLNTATNSYTTYLLTPLPASLNATLGSSSVDGSGNYVENIVISNTGSAPANVPQLTSASLVVVRAGKQVTIPTSTALPAVQHSLVPGAFTTLTLSFPPSAGTAGAAAALRWSITYSAGSASGTLRLALP